MPDSGNSNFDKFAWHKAYGEQQDVPFEARGVAYIIFDHARGDGTGARPGQALMAKKIGRDVRTVRRHLDKNVDAGWLVLVSKGSNSGRAAKNSVYRLAFPQQHRTLVTGTSDMGDTNTGHPRQETPETPDTGVLLTEPLTGPGTGPGTNQPRTGEPEPDETPSWKTWEGTSDDFAFRWRSGVSAGLLTYREFRNEYTRRKERDEAERAERMRQDTHDYLSRLNWLSEAKRTAITAEAERKGMPPIELRRLAQDCLPHRVPNASSREGLFAYKVREWTEADLPVYRKYEEP